MPWYPGVSGTSNFSISDLATDFEPIARMASALGPTKAMPCACARLGELGVLGEEPVAGMNRFGAGRLRGGEDLLDGEVRLSRGRGAEANRAIGEADVARRGVGVGVDRDGLDAEPACGADDATGDFAAIGNQAEIETWSFLHPENAKAGFFDGRIQRRGEARPSTRRLSAGSSTPSSQRRAVA